MWALLRALKADFAVTECELFSPLPYEECIRRIREEVSLLPIGPRPMVGRVRKDHIQVCKRISGSNAMQTQMIATFLRKGQGTRIYCQFGLRPSVAIFFVVWFMLIAVLGPAAIVALLTAPAHIGLGLGPALFAALVVTAVLGLGGVLVHTSRRSARDEQAFLTDLLKTKLNAVVITQ